MLSILSSLAALPLDGFAISLIGDPSAGMAALFILPAAVLSIALLALAGFSGARVQPSSSATKWFSRGTYFMAGAGAISLLALLFLE